MRVSILFVEDSYSYRIIGDELNQCILARCLDALSIDNYWSAEEDELLLDVEPKNHQKLKNLLQAIFEVRGWEHQIEEL